MTENNEKKYGRTFFDLIAERPKPTFYIFLCILAVAVALIIFRIPFKVGNVEVGNNQSNLQDTVIKVKTDTLYIDKPSLTVKAPIIKKLSKKVSLSSIVKAPLVQNSSSNVNSGTNNGIIGNNNDVKINLDEIQRKLDEPSKHQLLALIHQTIEHESILDTCIKLSAVNGSSEAFVLASEILQFLKDQKFKVNNIGQFQRAPAVVGVEIGVERNSIKKCVEILVGYKKK